MAHLATLDVRKRPRWRKWLEAHHGFSIGDMARLLQASHRGRVLAAGKKLGLK